MREFLCPACNHGIASHTKASGCEVVVDSRYPVEFCWCDDPRPVEEKTQARIV